VRQLVQAGPFASIDRGKGIDIHSTTIAADPTPAAG
jgi:hypothetical protein